MNTSELTARQAELDRQLHDQAYLASLSMEQSNLLRREKETIDATLATQGQVAGAQIPPDAAVVREGIAAPVYVPDQDPGNQIAGAAARATQRAQEAPLAQNGSNPTVETYKGNPRASSTQEQPDSQQNTQQKARAQQDTAVTNRDPSPVQKANQKNAPIVAPKSAKVAKSTAKSGKGKK